MAQKLKPGPVRVRLGKACEEGGRNLELLQPAAIDVLPISNFKSQIDGCLLAKGTEDVGKGHLYELGQRTAKILLNGPGAH